MEYCLPKKPILEYANAPHESLHLHRNKQFNQTIRIAMKHRIHQLGIVICSLLIMLSIGGIGYLTWVQTAHVVIPGTVYRSGQLPPASLSNAIKTLRIRSILNLRGASLGIPWYDQEQAVVRRLNIHYYNLPLNAYQRPTMTQIHQLIDIIQHAPKPLLIHCQSGADRSGFASAVALLAYQKDSFPIAKQQFSWRYFALSPMTVGQQVFHNPQQAKLLLAALTTESQ